MSLYLTLLLSLLLLLSIFSEDVTSRDALSQRLSSLIELKHRTSMVHTCTLYSSTDSVSIILHLQLKEEAAQTLASNYSGGLIETRIKSFLSPSFSKVNVHTYIHVYIFDIVIIVHIHHMHNIYCIILYTMYDVRMYLCNFLVSSVTWYTVTVQHVPFALLV